MRGRRDVPARWHSMFDVRCSMFDVRCSMFDVRCSMFDVRCSMFDVRCSMFDVRCSIAACPPVEPESKGKLQLGHHRSLWKRMEEKVAAVEQIVDTQRGRPAW